VTTKEEAAVLKILKSIPWKRVLTVVVPMVGAWENLPPSSRTVGVAGSMILAGLSGLGINAEKYVAKRSTPAEPFNTSEAASKLDKVP